MKNNILKTTSIAILIFICLIVYLTMSNISKYNIIDMTGDNGIWRAGLNINVGYSNDLMITSVTNELELDSEIIIDVFVKDKNIYTDRLKVIKNNKSSNDGGVYRCRFDSNKYLEKNHESVYLIISSYDESSKVPFTLISYPLLSK